MPRTSCAKFATAGSPTPARRLALGAGRRVGRRRRPRHRRGRRAHHRAARPTTHAPTSASTSRRRCSTWPGSRFPDADLREGNAVDLRGLPDAAYDLVLFSFNGLDALDHGDRGAALAAMARVTRPEGRVLFSSLNLDGVSFDERPWRVAGGLLSPRVRYHVAYAARHPGSMVRSVQNYRRTRQRRRGRSRLGPAAAARPRVQVRRALRDDGGDGRRGRRGRARGGRGVRRRRQRARPRHRRTPTRTTCTSSAAAR